MLYDFEVVRDGNVILKQTMHLPDISHAWPAINQLARTVRAPQIGPAHGF